MPPLQGAATDGPQIVITLPNTLAGASLARKQFLHFAEHLRLDRNVIADVEIAVGEALANAAEHGYRLDGTIQVEVRLTTVGLEIAVSDDGAGFVPRPREAAHPAAMSPRGYGMFLMHTVVDEIEYSDNGKTVWFLRRF